MFVLETFEVQVDVHLQHAVAIVTDRRHAGFFGFLLLNVVQLLGRLTKLDVQMLDWLRANEVPHTVVATKLDKVKPSKLGSRKKELAKAAGLDKGGFLDRCKRLTANPPNGS